MSPLFFALALASSAGSVYAATTPRMAPLGFSAAQHAQRMSTLAPSLRQWVGEEARRLDTAQLDIEQVKYSARQRLAGQDFADADIEALALLVLQQAAKDADEDLRAVAEDMRAQRERRKAMREAQHAQREASAESKQAARQEEARDDATAESAEETQMRLQALQDRRSQALEAASNLLKKQSDTASNISANLK